MKFITLPLIAISQQTNQAVNQLSQSKHMQLVSKQPTSGCSHCHQLKTRVSHPAIEPVKIIVAHSFNFMWPQLSLVSKFSSLGFIHMNLTNQHTLSYSYSWNNTKSIRKVIMPHVFIFVVGLLGLWPGRGVFTGWGVWLHNRQLVTQY